MRILVVDDEWGNARSLSRLLEKGGHDVTALCDPFAALTTYREQRFDVVFSDVRMPGMTGLELLRKLKDHDPAARVILVTGFGDSQTALQAIHNAAWGFLAKPVNVHDIMRIVDHLQADLNDPSPTPSPNRAR